MYLCVSATNGFVFLYFVPCAWFGGLFLINLTLAVIVDIYQTEMVSEKKLREEEEDRERERQEAEAKAVEEQARRVPGEPLFCFCTERPGCFPSPDASCALPSFPRPHPARVFRPSFRERP